MKRNPTAGILLNCNSSNFYQAQATFYKPLQEVDQRQERFERQQADIVEILKILTQQNRQQN